MEIDRNSSDVISLAQAVQYTHSYQKKNPGAIKSFFAGSNKLDLILKQEGCIGIRIYNGYNDLEGKANLVLVGVNGMGEDMTKGVILQELTPCPNICPKSSELMSY